MDRAPTRAAYPGTMTDAPRRRQSPAVYRRRRLVAVLLVLAVIGLVVWLVAAPPWAAAPTSSEATPAPSSATTTPSPAASPSPTSTPSSPSPSPTTDATPVSSDCTAADIKVEALTDKTAYSRGEDPKLSIRLTNTGTRDCTMNVGTSAQSFTVTSGSDVWWRSTDCQTQPSDMPVTLKAGQTVTSSAPLTWDRTRSSTSSCSGERPFAPGGGATYHLSVSIGGIPSSGTASFILE